MGLIALILYWVVFVYYLCLWVRIIIELVINLNRSYRPSGFVAVIFEIIFTVTDPPLKLLRKFIKPLPLGPVLLDLNPLILLFTCSILLRILASYF